MDGRKEGRLLSIEKPAYKVGPKLACGNLNCAWYPQFLELVRVAHCTCTVWANNMVYAEHLLSLPESGIWVHDRQKLSMWPSPSKNSGHWVSDRLPWLTTFHTCCHNSLLDELSPSYGIPAQRALGWLLAPGFPWALPMCLPLLVVFALHSLSKIISIAMLLPPESLKQTGLRISQHSKHYITLKKIILKILTI
jgi:hypothetical protein